ncbi:peptidase P60, partial [Clostridioides difficile]|nr:peptidase P60 [Clostridioides difficile]
MERRMKRKFHVRCEAGENLEITSKSYLSLSDLADLG